MTSDQQIASTSKFKNFVQNVRRILMLPMTIALLLSCISTAIKTAAWYGQTIIPDEKLFPIEWPPYDPQYRDVVITTLKTLLSWSIALFEYIPLTMANSLADQAQINLTNLRGAIEAMDLGWFVLFLHFAKRARLNWHQWVGLALAGVGCAIVNKPDWLFPEFDKKVEKLQSKIGEDCLQFFERICKCLGMRKEEVIDPESITNSRQNSITSEKVDKLQLPIPTFINKLNQKLDSSLNQQIPNIEEMDKSSNNGICEEGELKRDCDFENPESDPKNKSTTPSLNESDENSNKSTKIFVIGWIIGQTLFYGLAVLMFLKHKRLFAVLSLSASATGVKTIAWYLHTVLGNKQLLPPSLTPKSPKSQTIAFATVKVIMSWFIALGEYIPLTLANRTADMHGISLAKVRGAIEAMDLLWLAAFMLLVKGEKLRWQHLVGLTVAGIGVGIANTDAPI